ncbi:conjugal transfer protein TraF [Paracoccus liaowanqingii]|uniref:Conjugal transfer protein TraF n=1 Tax=Paracoccus liaowanqingii TaxID=2560053 RepID=A0A4Z1CSL9_9RHOB|nr:type IV secretion system protein [Paracoccus liaowanqingii]TGN68316.1 conjugal transfer protein TraF [Paracoccus liaowanqingii]
MRNAANGLIAGAGLCLSLTLTVPTPVTAQGVPTVDTQSIAQQITQIRRMLEDYGIQTDMLDQLVEQLAELQSQTAELQQIYAVLTGSADIQGLLMGGELDAVLDPKMTSILQAASSASSGDWSGLSSGYRARIQAAAQSTMIGAGLDPARVEDMGREGTVAERRAASQATTGALVAASADTAQRETAVSLQRLDNLVGEIPQQTGIKAAIDLNTRMMGEAVSELIKNNQLLAIQSYGMGMSDVSQASAWAQEQQMLDFTMPDLQ